MNGSPDRIWRFRKVDVLFLVGIGVIVYGLILGRLDMIVAGAGIAGAPLMQRVDKG